VSPGVHLTRSLATDAVQPALGHAGRLKLGDQNPIIISTQPQCYLSVRLVDQIPDAVYATLPRSLHTPLLLVVVALFVVPASL